MSESIGQFKRPENQSDFKMKNMIGNGMKMFRKYQLDVCIEYTSPEWDSNLKR
jgi:hypothetical protein